MSSELAIDATGLGKAYAIFDRPQDRLKQMLMRGRRTYYREFWALRDVDLEIYRGETVGVIGANGSGKSTLLQLVCGNLAQTTGEIAVSGRIAPLLQLGTGFNPEFTGRENVFLSAVIMGCAENEIAGRFEDIAAFAEIGDFIDQPVKTYSSGMYARLAFAVAINVDPDILLVDEVLAVGDEAFKRKCFARIEDIKYSGGTILFVSHAAKTIVDLCDRAVLLCKGERLFTGEAKMAVSYYQKLINANQEYSDEICAEIRAADSAARAEARSESRDIADNSWILGTPQPEMDFADWHQEQKRAAPIGEQAEFDPNLVSKSMVVYTPNGAEIRNPRIVADNGQNVNCLVSGERYWFCYDISFARDCRSVRFYTNIRTVSGVLLGGGTYPETGAQGVAVSTGQTGTLRLQFTCSLNSGTYFVSCGLGGDDGQSLHRIIDAVAFRVFERPRIFSIGYVDFLCSPELHLEGP